MTSRRDRSVSQLELEGMPGTRGRTGRVRRGVDAQLRAQRELGGIEPVDAGLIAIARTLADAADAEYSATDGSRFTVSALLGRLVPVLLELRGESARHGADVDSELERLVTAIRDVTRPNAPDAR